MKKNKLTYGCLVGLAGMMMSGCLSSKNDIIPYEEVTSKKQLSGLSSVLYVSNSYGDAIKSTLNEKQNIQHPTLIKLHEPEGGWKYGAAIEMNYLRPGKNVLKVWYKPKTDYIGISASYDIYGYGVEKKVGDREYVFMDKESSDLYDINVERLGKIFLYANEYISQHKENRALYIKKGEEGTRTYIDSNNDALAHIPEKNRGGTITFITKNKDPFLICYVGDASSATIEQEIYEKVSDVVWLDVVKEIIHYNPEYRYHMAGLYMNAQEVYKDFEYPTKLLGGTRNFEKGLAYVYARAHDKQEASRCAAMLNALKKDKTRKKEYDAVKKFYQHALAGLQMCPGHKLNYNSILWASNLNPSGSSLEYLHKIGMPMRVTFYK